MLRFKGEIGGIGGRKVTPIYLGGLRKNPIGTFWKCFAKKNLKKYQFLSGVVNICEPKVVILALSTFSGI